MGEPISNSKTVNNIQTSSINNNNKTNETKQDSNKNIPEDRKVSAFGINVSNKIADIYDNLDDMNIKDIKKALRNIDGLDSKERKAIIRNIEHQKHLQEVYDAFEAATKDSSLNVAEITKGFTKEQKDLFEHQLKIHTKNSLPKWSLLSNIKESDSNDESENISDQKESTTNSKEALHELYGKQPDLTGIGPMITPASLISPLLQETRLKNPEESMHDEF